MQGRRGSHVFFGGGGGKGSISPTNSIGKKNFPDKNILIYLLPLPAPSTTFLVKKFSGQKNVTMDHLHYRLNFDLDKNFITA